MLVKDRPALEALAEQAHENQIDILVIKDTLALLMARLVASRVIDKNFVEDLSVCLDGLDHGRDMAVETAAPKEMMADLKSVEQDVRASRTRLLGLIDRLILSFNR